MSLKQDKPVIPRAIYFDTSALRQLPRDISNVEFLQLKDLAQRVGVLLFAPQVVIMEWIRHSVKEAHELLQTLEETSKKIGRLLSREPLKYEKPGDIEKKVIELMNSYLSKAGINIIPTPDIPLDKLIEMAVNKVPPFEEKKEKGFRDSVILFTIIHHMSTLGVSDAILVCNDHIFSHEDIKNRLSKANLNLLIASNVPAAKDLLKEQVDIAVLAFMEETKQRIKSFLISRSEEIFKYVLENAEISKSFLTGGIWGESKDMPIGSTIKRILNVRPKEVSEIYYGLEDSQVPERKVYSVTFSIATEFDIIIEQSLTFFTGPKFKLSSPEAFEAIGYQAPEVRERQITITRNINVQARCYGTDEGLFELEFIKVLT